MGYEAGFQECFEDLFFDCGCGEGVIDVVFEAAVVCAEVCDFERNMAGRVEGGIECLFWFPGLDWLDSGYGQCGVVRVGGRGAYLRLHGALEFEDAGDEFRLRPLGVDLLSCLFHSDPLCFYYADGGAAAAEVEDGGGGGAAEEKSSDCLRAVGPQSH